MFRFDVWGLGLGVWGLGYRVYRLGCRGSGVRCRVQRAVVRGSGSQNMLVVGPARNMLTLSRLALSPLSLSRSLPPPAKSSDLLVEDLVEVAPLHHHHPLERVLY